MIVKTITNTLISMALKRITIMFDEDLLKKLHEKQAKLVRNSTKSISLSFVVNETLRQGLK